MAKISLLAHPAFTRTAKSRHDFLNEFPHGYKTLKGRKVHEDLRDMAIKRADEYEMKAKKHVEYAR